MQVLYCPSAAVIVAASCRYSFGAMMTATDSGCADTFRQAQRRKVQASR